MKILVGLGNPGPQYAATRHNAGWMTLDRFAESRGLRFRTERRFRGDIAEVDVPGAGRVLLLKPLTFMNSSGESVIAAAQFYKVDPADILVVVDDIALPLGLIRVRAHGSAGGHNGLKSLIAHLNTREFPRIRIGVGAPVSDAIDHVLGTFRKEEWAAVHESTVLAADAALVALTEGVEVAMNRFNVRAKADAPAAGDSPADE